MGNCLGKRVRDYMENLYTSSIYLRITELSGRVFLAARARRVCAEDNQEMQPANAPRFVGNS